MKITNLYSKNFSEIKDIQNEKLLEYNLFESKVDDKINYGIQITSFDGRNREEYISEVICDNKEFVQDVVKYLYENSVDIDTCEYVLNDLFINLNIKKQTIK